MLFVMCISVAHKFWLPFAVPPRSGVIDRDEFQGLWNNLREHGLTTHDMETCLQDIDANADGKIQFNEFMAWLDRQPNSA